MDFNGRVESIALEKSKSVEFGDHIITQDSPCFVIAEIGNNHNGSFNLALEMIDAAASAGADCVKFQMRNINSLYRKKSLCMY